MGMQIQKSKCVFLKTIILACISSILLSGCDAVDVIQSYFPQPEMVTATDQNPDMDSDAQVSPTSIPTEIPIKDGEILVWLPPQFDPHNASEGAQLFNGHVGSFQIEHPALVVEFRVKADRGLNSILDSLSITSAAAPGALPTIVLLSMQDMRIAADQGLIQPIEFLSDELEESDWYPAAKEMGTYKGETYGLPAALDAMVMVTRSEKLSGSYLSLDALAQQPGEFGYMAGNISTLVPYIWYASSGGSWDEEDGQLIFDEQQLTALIDDLVVNRQARSLTSRVLEYQSQEQLWDAFSKRQLDSIFTWYSYTSHTDTGYSTAFLPARGETPYTFSDGWMWCLVQNDAADRQSNIQFMEHVVSAEFSQEWTDLMQYLPVRQNPEALEQGFDHQLLQSSHLPPDKAIRDLSKDALSDAIIDVLTAKADSQDIAQVLVSQLKEARVE